MPIILAFAPVFLFLLLTGENYYSIDSIITSDNKYLIGYAYNENNYRYLKWKSILIKKKQKIWALGSSRVLSFRANMFESSFYNSGYTISSIVDFLPFLKSIPEEKYPEILIVGLDQWMFNKNWDNLSNIKSEKYWKSSFSINPSSNTIISIIKDFFSKKYGLYILSKRYDNAKNLKRVGLNALVNNKGFRNDGSIFYGSQIEMLLNDDSLANDFDYSDTYSRIENGNRRFQYGNKPNPAALQKLDEFLQFCSSKGIFIIGFIPPFANKVNQKLKETANYGYLDFIYPQASQYFKKYNYELWDMSDLEIFNSGDDETIDGFHGGELAYLKMLIYMGKNNSILSSHINVSRLEKDIMKRKNRYIVYGY